MQGRSVKLPPLLSRPRRERHEQLAGMLLSGMLANAELRNVRSCAEGAFELAGDILTLADERYGREMPPHDADGKPLVEVVKSLATMEKVPCPG